ncbi:MAG TPA: carboxy-S-adenosyl-L-methionine synthase CmoA [Desulfobulbaceae bacterium]|nr:carboxy-S-adenosyl-L-methionine synthase CmoA [Desulfobulbaceae bacterium]
MNRDTIFQHIDIKEDFSFNEQVAEVFDDMVHRSVPLYETVIDAIARILNQHVGRQLTVYDLGCSTGTTLLELSRRIQHQKLRLIGIDNAGSMLEKARKKAAMFCKTDFLSFREDDITSCPLTGADAILCNYTLQFVRPPVRRTLVDRFYQALPPGGLLIVCEKIIAAGAFHRPFIDIYHDFKREQGYSELEIAAKREALENVLVPFTVDENISLLQEAGFSQVEIFCKWFNFASFVALKN